jgi:hypothetical protein
MDTTLSEIKKHKPCRHELKTLQASLDSYPHGLHIRLDRIIKSNGVEFAIWCLRAVEGFAKEKRLLAVAFARQLDEHLSDQAKNWVDVSERFAKGLASAEELAYARLPYDLYEASLKYSELCYKYYEKVEKEGEGEIYYADHVGEHANDIAFVFAKLHEYDTDLVRAAYATTLDNPSEAAMEAANSVVTWLERYGETAKERKELKEKALAKLEEILWEMLESLE